MSLIFKSDTNYFVSDSCIPTIVDNRKHDQLMRQQHLQRLDCRGQSASLEKRSISCWEGYDCSVILRMEDWLHKDGNMSNSPNTDYECLDRRWIAVCMGTGCMSSASAELREALHEELDKHNLNGLVEVDGPVVSASASKGQF